LPPRYFTDDETDTESEELYAGDDEPVTQVWTFDLGRWGDSRQVADFEEGIESFD
jgi:hypothetical protein